MAIDYPALAQVAVDLITDNGREIQLLTLRSLTGRNPLGSRSRKSPEPSARQVETGPRRCRPRSDDARA